MTEGDPITVVGAIVLMAPPRSADTIVGRYREGWKAGKFFVDLPEGHIVLRFDREGIDWIPGCFRLPQKEAQALLATHALAPRSEALPVWTSPTRTGPENKSPAPPWIQTPRPPEIPWRMHQHLIKKGLRRR